ncbi:hypothetical protein ANO14919_003900 [Xylariales sp. No.14919]|nr:hypothetical protein ANO14919_003900 [Xylariales sp. No.14919]
MKAWTSSEYFACTVPQTSSDHSSDHGSNHGSNHGSKVLCNLPQSAAIHAPLMAMEQLHGDTSFVDGGPPPTPTYYIIPYASEMQVFLYEVLRDVPLVKLP